QEHACILDSLWVHGVRLRGDFSNRLAQVERQVVQIQELTGQGQQRRNELRESIAAREEARRQTQVTIDPATVGDPDELFESAEAALDRGSIATARAGFEEFTAALPRPPLAPAARLYPAAMLNGEVDIDAALDQYSRVLQLPR